MAILIDENTRMLIQGITGRFDHLAANLNHASGDSLAETTGDPLYQHSRTLINQYRHKYLQCFKRTFFNLNAKWYDKIL